MKNIASDKAASAELPSIVVVAHLQDMPLKIVAMGR
jgi:hypothetical protein